MQDLKLQNKTVADKLITGIATMMKASEIKQGAAFEQIRRFSAQSNIATPRVFISDSNAINALALPLGDGAVILPKGMLNRFGGSVSGGLSPKAASVAAHEIGHLKAMLPMNYTLKKVAPLWLMPAGFILGGRQAKAHYAQAEQPDNRPSTRAGTLMQDAALGTAGIFAGAETIRFISLQEEHYCDKHAATLTGVENSRQTLVELHDLQTQRQNGTLPPNDPFRKLGESQIAGKGWFGRYLVHCRHAHPSLERRLKALDRLKPAGQEAGALVAEVASLGKVAFQVARRL